MRDRKTTMTYTHINTESIGKIRSPLDKLDLKQEVGYPKYFGYHSNFRGISEFMRL